MICTETNDYVQQQLNNPTRRRLYDDEKWQPIVIDELKAYFALYILMGQVRKPTLKMNWSVRKIEATKIFSEVMSYQRFMVISRYLHFSDDNDTSAQDKLRKLRPVLRYLEANFMHTYTKGQKVVIDESLMRLRERLSYIQYKPKKRARFGVKLYKICESFTGYCG